MTHQLDTLEVLAADDATLNLWAATHVMGYRQEECSKVRRVAYVPVNIGYRNPSKRRFNPTSNLYQATALLNHLLASKVISGWSTSSTHETHLFDTEKVCHCTASWVIPEQVGTTYQVGHSSTSLPRAITITALFVLMNTGATKESTP